MKPVMNFYSVYIYIKVKVTTLENAVLTQPEIQGRESSATLFPL